MGGLKARKTNRVACTVFGVRSVNGQILVAACPFNRGRDPTAGSKAGSNRFSPSIFFVGHFRKGHGSHLRRRLGCRRIVVGSLIGDQVAGGNPGQNIWRGKGRLESVAINISFVDK